MTAPTEAERYIRFQLEHLTARNEHHTFEEIAFRIAERRLSSNLLPATGPVSAGGDQGRDTESYYTNLPKELPGAGGFVGRATTEPLVVAASVQRTGLDAKIRSDLQSICEQGEQVAKVAFFAVQEIPIAARHRLQAHARETHGVNLEIFDGQAVAHMLAHGDLAWVAQRYLDLPSNLVPEATEEPQPGWYSSTLAALRSREVTRLSQGAFSEVRDGLRHATFEAEARIDLPEWLRYMREFVHSGHDVDLAVRARYECAVATLRGLNTLDGVEDDIRAVVDHAITSDVPSMVGDASVLLMYWGGAWSRHIGTVTPKELRDRNLRLREHVRRLLDRTDESTHPIRKARLLDVAAHLRLHPRWPEVERPPTGALPTPQETSLLRRASEEAGELVVLDSGNPLDVSEAMEHLSQLVALLPQARPFPLGTVSQIFQMLAPALADDPRYAGIRDALDAAVAAVEGDNAIAERCRTRAIAFRRAGRPLDALRELHNAKINWWHGDTLRASLLAMRLIGQIYAELRLVYAAKQYALAAATVALSAGEDDLQDLVPEALIDAMDHCYAAGNWADSLALAHIAVLAHSHLAENAFDHESHSSLRRIDFDALTALLAAERFRPSVLPLLHGALGNTGYEEALVEMMDGARGSFTFTEQEFTAQAGQQLSGHPFSDLGPRRTLTFAALGITWWITCDNDRRSVLAAERFAAAAQILLVELAPADPAFLAQDVHVDLLVGTPFGTEGNVRFKPNNESVVCSVILSPFGSSTDLETLNLELAASLVQLLAHLSARPQDEFIATVEEAFAAGLLHKLHVGRPYDEVAGILDKAHYAAISAVVIPPLEGAPLRPAAASELQPPTTHGPGYDHAAALEHVRDNYEYLPTVLNQTLRRALADPVTMAGFEELRRDGWLDWHLLIAISNAVFNFRARAAGLLDRPTETTAQQRELLRQPETDQSEPIPLSALTPASLRTAMNIAVLAIGQRRWRVGTVASTPNVAAFKEFLESRYGYAADDVPHRDLLSEALDGDGTLRPLV